MNICILWWINGDKSGARIRTLPHATERIRIQASSLAIFSRYWSVISIYRLTRVRRHQQRGRSCCLSGPLRTDQKCTGTRSSWTRWQRRRRWRCTRCSTPSRSEEAEQRRRSRRTPHSRPGTTMRARITDPTSFIRQGNEKEWMLNNTTYGLIDWQNFFPTLILR